jgi:hypothetical protein
MIDSRLMSCFQPDVKLLLQKHRCQASLDSVHCDVEGNRVSRVTARSANLRKW